MFLDLFNEMIGICIVTEMVINTLSIKSVVVLGPDYVCFFFFFNQMCVLVHKDAQYFGTVFQRIVTAKKLNIFFRGHTT